jgi:hypothetical protein
MLTERIRKISLHLEIELELPPGTYSDFDDPEQAKILMQESFDSSNFGFEGIGVAVNKVIIQASEFVDMEYPD